MEKILKEIFISNDGYTFDTEESCLQWENRKYEMALSDLTDTQIVQLLKAIHWNLNGEDQETTVRIEISGDLEEDTGFTYQVTISSPDPDYREFFQGTIHGRQDFCISAYRSVTPVKALNNHALKYGFSFCKVYKYLESIQFFDERDIPPIRNPNIDGSSWITISEECFPR